MALQVFNSDSVGPGYQANIGTDDDLYVKAGVLLASTDFAAVYGEGIGQSVHIDGTLVSVAGTIEWGPFSAIETGNDLLLGASSLLKCFGGAGSAAVLLTGGDWDIDMRGFVFSTGQGLQVADGTGADSTITNSGEISVALRAITILSADNFVIDNSGIVRGLGTAISASGDGVVNLENSGKIVGNVDGAGSGVLRIENSGVIKGIVQLGAQADIYDGQFGALKGAIEGGAGDDKIIGGTEKTRIQGDAGRDLITGGLGADLFIYNVAGDSTLDASGRDLITDFSHKSRDIIDFSTLIPGELDFVGKSHFAGADEIRFQVIGKSTFVYVNLDADQEAEMAIQCTGKIKFVQADFAI